MKRNYVTVTLCIQTHQCANDCLGSLCVTAERSGRTATTRYLLRHEATFIKEIMKPECRKASIEVVGLL